jgi:hypothetical protein
MERGHNQRFIGKVRDIGSQSVIQGHRGGLFGMQLMREITEISQQAG